MFLNMDPDSRGAALKMYKVAKGMKLDEIRAKEDAPPDGWIEKADDDGRVYYVNSETKDTQYVHPKTGRTRILEGDLPYGWERRTTEDGRTAFVNDKLRKATYRDPRLNPIKVEKPEFQAPHTDFAAKVTAMEILSGLDMSGWVIMITGATSGIGFETARSLAYHGAHVIMACRNVEKAEDKKAEIAEQCDSSMIDVIECDLSSFESIEHCAATFLEMGLPLHVLILNAAVYGTPFTLTADTNLELTFAVNHMGHFYLTKLLTQRLIESAPAQVIVVSSEQHRKAGDIGNFDGESPPDLMLTVEKIAPPSKADYFWSYSYFLSKLCNLWFCFQLNKRLLLQGVTANAVNPGSMIRTSLPRESCFLRALYALVKPWTKTLPQAAASVVYTAVLPENLGGQYIDNCCPIEPHPAANDAGLQKRLWQISEGIVAKYHSDKKSKDD